MKIVSKKHYASRKDTGIQEQGGVVKNLCRSCDFVDECIDASVYARRKAESRLTEAMELLDECNQLLVGHHNSSYRPGLNGKRCSVCTESGQYPNDIFGKLQAFKNKGNPALDTEKGKEVKQ